VKPLCTLTNTFKENCGQFAGKICWPIRSKAPLNFLSSTDYLSSISRFFASTLDTLRISIILSLDYRLLFIVDY